MAGEDDTAPYPCSVLQLPYTLWRVGYGAQEEYGAWVKTGGTNTIRSTVMGNTTDAIKKGIKEAAGAVKDTAEKTKDKAVRAVDKGKDAAARTADKVKDKTARAADKVKHA